MLEDGIKRFSSSISSFLKNIRLLLNFIGQELPEFLLFLRIFITDKVLFFSQIFERNKNLLVKSILLQRGRKNRAFLHISAMSLFAAGVLISPVISDANFFGGKKNVHYLAQSQPVPIFQDDVFETDVSSKPRDKIIDYTVQKGDTISSIAKRFGISEDTIRWANDLRTDNITVGDTLKILPVTGIAHKVEPGDTVYSIAKKYSANPQAIVDFPFNEFANPQVFSLVVGQIIIVPDGVKPQEAPRYTRPRYIATGPVSVSVAGFTWPLQGTISQLFSWYHQGIDIAASYGAPIIAAQSGVVKEVHSGGWNWGYGVNVVVAGANGYDTRYAHMSGVNVAVGQEVVAGKTIIGWVGLTGRTTGPHLHFEIFNPSGGFLNPISFLK